MQVRKQQLELDMEQQTGSKQEKQYFKGVYCHPAYLTSMKSTSLPEASVRNPAHDKVMRKEADIHKVVIRLQGPPGISGACTPTTTKKSAGFCTLLFHFSDILWKKVNSGL